ncbi:MAG: cobaltochelatase subunit CobN [Thalassobaculum sp.]|uniref:cobaltochelatase subunit CobN n=1 Tax=Thalassobaculum sp. TaxID=2022740 RepID=UPI0032EF203A
MHLLATRSGAVDDGSEAADLGQTPGDVVVLSAADTDLAGLATARARRPAGATTLRLANVMRLLHHLSVDLYAEEIVAKARLVVVRLIGGVAYWPYGIEQIAGACRENGVGLACVPGDDTPDADLMGRSTLPAEAVHRIWRYLQEGGPENAGQMLAYADDLLGRGGDWREPAPIPRAGLYWPGLDRPDLDAIRARWPSPDAPAVPLVFYRALVQAGQLAPVDAMVEALAERGLGAVPIYAQSLKEPTSAALVSDTLAACPPALILNATSFAVSQPGKPVDGPFAASDRPVLQVVFSSGARDAWETGTRGLGPRDIAMHVALPEIDGRLLTRAVSFKGDGRWDEATECPIVAPEPVPDRVAHVADLATAWARLGATPPAKRRIALVLANYPTREGRLGNGVGLDTPAATVAILRALREAGYAVDGIPEDGDALMRTLSAGPTNALEGRSGKAGGEDLTLADYARFLDRVPAAARTLVTDRWGAPAADPHVEGDRFRLAVHRLGNVAVAIQPARGYHIDPKASYHDPDLPPPHGYLAFHAWLRDAFDAHAVVFVGKHGNLEWLPGKALALSESCFPEVALGPLPVLYPFIVNDPGEGSQAKRRIAATVIDHLTPPLTRAELHGPLQELEALVDEYFQAMGVDPRRLPLLSERILDAARRTGLDKDVGIDPDEADEIALGKLDNHLCELKELQIRDGLHVFGSAPQGRLLTDLLVALARVPRGRGEGGDASLPRALAADLGLAGFDPLDPDPAAAWAGPRPEALAAVDGQPWRTQGDTVERLEILSAALVSGDAPCPAAWPRTATVLDQVESRLRPSVLQSGPDEIANLLRGLDGRFVPPGPSGAPSRGRPDVLPTGRNFYSVDTRAVPTPAAWTLGWKSAGLVLDRYRQENGDWPQRLAVSAWGTANMRTGGDDIAQILAFLGVRPEWEPASGRVTGFEILPLSVLDRPRVDVTVRVSGFFRDAFPHQIDLIDSAVRAVAALDEPAALNPVAARVQADAERMTAAGVDEALAKSRAAFRVFGSKPGAYGAGLQALIDERIWDTEADLAEAYLEWGAYAYGQGAEGASEPDLFRARLAGAELVVHNQDNREHDLLDSDDYYQFEGGITAAVRHLSGAQPTVFHTDSSRPESPKVRTLAEEIARIVRGRAANPKWIAGVMRHGYKGGFEIAATVDYLFAFAATARCVDDHHFEQLFDAYLEDDTVRGFLVDHNPAALKEIAERFQEAIDRGLWHPRRNAVQDRLAALMEGETR